MGLNKILEEQFSEYKKANPQEFIELRIALNSMTCDLKLDIDTSLQSITDFFRNDFKNGKINSFQELGQLLIKLICEPINMEHTANEIFIGSAWSSFVNPTVVHPLNNFEKFYDHVEYFHFLHPHIFESSIDPKVYIPEMKSFFYYYEIKESFIKAYEIWNDQFFNVITEDREIKNNVYYHHSLVKLISTVLNEIYRTEQFKDDLFKINHFDKLRESFLTNILNKNILFKDPEKAFIKLYEKLASKNLVDIDYSSFRTILIVDEGRFGDIKIQNKINVSLEGTFFQVADIGMIFKDFKAVHHIGNKTSFTTWLKSNFIFLNREGKPTSMSDHNLRKMV